MTSSSRILLSQADITPHERDAVAQAVLSGWVAPLGPEVDAFEAELAERTGVAHALALSSGTAALHLGLLGVGVQRGDAVVVPSMTFAASANAIAYTGAEPVLVDSELLDGNVDPELLLHAVDTLQAEGRPARAVMSVDLLGRCADYDGFAEELHRRGIPLVEDAAEALDASYHGRAAGGFGACAALSFNGNKILTTSGGGMLLSDDAELIARARYLSTQARQPVPWYEHTEIGYNYRLSNLLAALGRAQLSRLTDMVARRRAIRERYAETVADIPGVRLLARGADRDDATARDGGSVRDDRHDNCWLTSIVLDPEQTGSTPERLIAAFGEHDIEARHLWKPMHRQPVFAGARSFLTGNAERLFATGVTLPSGSALSDADVERVCEVLTTSLRTGRAA